MLLDEKVNTCLTSECHSIKTVAFKYESFKNVFFFIGLLVFIVIDDSLKIGMNALKRSDKAKFKSSKELVDLLNFAAKDKKYFHYIKTIPVHPNGHLIGHYKLCTKTSGKVEWYTLKVYNKGMVIIIPDSGKPHKVTNMGEVNKYFDYLESTYGGHIDKLKNSLLDYLRWDDFEELLKDIIPK